MYENSNLFHHNLPLLQDGKGLFGREKDQIREFFC